jgi:hypothetical protein
LAEEGRAQAWREEAEMTDADDVVVGWRGLSLEIGERLGRPVGLSKVRHRVEGSGLRVGRKLGGVLLFDESDVRTATRLMEEAGR